MNYFFKLYFNILGNQKNVCLGRKTSSNHENEVMVLELIATDIFGAIQVLSYNNPAVARQNVSITSILTNCTLDS